MYFKLVLRPLQFALLMLLALPASGWGQTDVTISPAKPLKAQRIKGEKPNQLDIFKIDVLQCGVNEVRLSYEFQHKEHSSFEIGIGGIFKNAFWYDRKGKPLPISGDTPMLANGAGVYFSFRQYMDRKLYFREPIFRSYFSPMLFYRFSAYEDEWLTITTSDPGINDCFLQSAKLHQVGAVARFGWQTTRGRIALDFYMGLGAKFNPTVVTTTVFTPLTAVCVINSTSIHMHEVEKTYGGSVIINAGIKLGIRRNNKERHYEDAPPADQGADPDSPPQF